MQPRLPFLAFALGLGLALATPTAAQAQVSVGVNIGPPAWGPPVPQGTQYYYIPEIDGYYDIYNGVYIVFDGYQWVPMSYLDGYDPYYFHPLPVSYVGAQPWLYINTYRQRYPQYVTVYHRGGWGGGGRYYGHDYGAGRVYGYDHGYNRGNYGYNNRPGWGGRPGGPDRYDNPPAPGRGGPGRGDWRPEPSPSPGPPTPGGPGQGGWGGGRPTQPGSGPGAPNGPGRRDFGGGQPGQPAPGGPGPGGFGNGGYSGGGRGRR